MRTKFFVFDEKKTLCHCFSLLCGFVCFSPSVACLLCALLFADFRICCVPFVSSFVHNRFFCVALAVFSRLPLCFWLHAQLCGDFDLRPFVRLYAALAGFGGPLLSSRIPAAF